MFKATTALVASNGVVFLKGKDDQPIAMIDLNSTRRALQTLGVGNDLQDLKFEALIELQSYLRDNPW